MVNKLSPEYLLHHPKDLLWLMVLLGLILTGCEPESTNNDETATNSFGHADTSSGESRSRSTTHLSKDGSITLRLLQGSSWLTIAHTGTISDKRGNPSSAAIQLTDQYGNTTVVYVHDGRSITANLGAYPVTIAGRYGGMEINVTVVADTRSNQHISE